MEIPTEIRQQIFEYVLDWKDVWCMQAREDPKNRASKFMQIQKGWENKSLKELPFHFETCPPMFRTNRQILCEAISVYLRRTVVISTPERSWESTNHVLSKIGRQLINSTILFPTATLLKLYHLVSGEKLSIVPRMIIDIHDWSDVDVLWPYDYDQLFRLWSDGLEFDFSYIHIKCGQACELKEEKKVHEAAIKMETYTWTKYVYLRYLFIENNFANLGIGEYGHSRLRQKRVFVH
jgi:hypothetical protein